MGRKMIIDVDTGVDDAEAIMLALSKPEIDVIGITCVNGNVAIDNVCRNTLRVLAVCERLNVPVFRGAEKSILGAGERASLYYHGIDGLGDVPNPEPVDMSMIQKEHAVFALIRLIKENPGEITLVALAPLTNIALALRLEPEIGSMLKEVYIMGGNIEGKGGHRLGAEFNFFVDPKAAYITLQEVKCPTTILSWETTRSLAGLGSHEYLKSPLYLKDFDILKHEAFNESNLVFKTALTELKANGKWVTEHYPIISEDDRSKLYSSIHLQTNTPCGLFNKVQFDIRLYFFRRGFENMVSMTKNTFVVKRDIKTNTKYVTKQIDELTKNHRSNDKENVTAIMPEQPDSPSCPVTAFEKYISKLNPKCDRLWQRPLDPFSEESEIWYYNSPVGSDTLAQFMNELSKLYNLSQVYTNHSIRATGGTILTECRSFADAQIMSVTGHKSVSSLAIYQRTSDKSKLKMGQKINALMNGEDIEQNNNLPSTSRNALPAPAQPLALPMASTSLMNVTQTTEFRNQLSGINLNDLFSNFESLPQMPIFHVCYIGSINININNK